MEKDAILTKKQVAEMLHCSPHFVDQLRKNKGLPYIKLGRSVRFRASDIQTWIEARTIVQIPVNTEIETY
ncbi:MAG: helix-turn-helix domain-containing protein [Planctomycetia bacterium]|nr:helix-turn-helix domain-containing protein [Planctomycetia bacterium]MDO4574979.1 helix-turn-helix domain-containing protein [Planctomycetia bacterium]